MSLTERSSTGDPRKESALAQIEVRTPRSGRVSINTKTDNPILANPAHRSTVVKVPPKYISVRRLRYVTFQYISPVKKTTLSGYVEACPPCA